jgi:predicted nucleic acid-binding protein
MQYLDANVILRYLTRDDPAKAERCLALLQRADQGQAELMTSEAVIAEVVYVLSSPRLYHLSRERIRDLLLPILNLRGLKLPSRQLYHRALDVYASHPVDFEDALAVAHMEQQGITEIVSYDRHFDGVAGVRRVEP